MDLCVGFCNHGNSSNFGQGGNKMKCKICGHVQPTRHTPDTFKKAFKVGDLVTCWASKRVYITGIGMYRVFYIDEDEYNKPLKDIKSGSGREKTHTMFDNWRGCS